MSVVAHRRCQFFRIRGQPIKRDLNCMFYDSIERQMFIRASIVPERPSLLIELEQPLARLARSRLDQHVSVLTRQASLHQQAKRSTSRSANSPPAASELQLYL